jgi:UDP-GlcNAc3NAcA epimerase
MIKIVTVVGARPQFIKAAAITRLIREEFKDQIIEIMVHTGQHFDKNMSSIFFEELEIPEPKYNLEISGGQHGAMTGRMLEAIEDVLLVEKPDWVLIYGDTNSTLAGAIAASKLHIPVAHVEAGLRSFNIRMPEEINRIIADRISNLLLCPTKTSVENLRKEALSASAHLVGDVMYDVSLFYQKRALERSVILQKMGLSDGKYVLTTCHRAENTDDLERLKNIVDALAKIAENIPVVFPIHPRTRKFLEKYQLQDVLKKVMLVDPLPYLDMVRLEQSAKVILTDSGGVQKEAFFYGVPCVTMRDETEWIETVDTGWNTLTGADTEAIIQAFLASDTPPQRTVITPYGEGNASELCLKAILQAHTKC